MAIGNHVLRYRQVGRRFMLKRVASARIRLSLRRVTRRRGNCMFGCTERYIRYTGGGTYTRYICRVSSVGRGGAGYRDFYSTRLGGEGNRHDLECLMRRPRLCDGVLAGIMVQK